MWKLQRKFLQYEGKKIEAQFFGYLTRNLAAIPTTIYRLPIMLVQVANREKKRNIETPRKTAKPRQPRTMQPTGSVSNM